MKSEGNVCNSPTLTAVLPSSSENLLDATWRPLLTLMRLALRTGLGCTIMLRGRWKPPAGEPGGEAAMTTSSGVAEVVVRKREGRASDAQN